MRIAPMQKTKQNKKSQNNNNHTLTKWLNAKPLEFVDTAVQQLLLVR